jgi:hypothetical protein
MNERTFLLEKNPKGHAGPKTLTRAHYLIFTRLYGHAGTQINVLASYY